MGKRRFYPLKKILGLLQARYQNALCTYLHQHGVPDIEIDRELFLVYRYIADEFQLTRRQLPTKKQMLDITDRRLIERRVARAYSPSEPPQRKPKTSKIINQDTPSLQPIDEGQLIYRKELTEEAEQLLRLDLLALDSELIKYLVQHPKLMYELDPRKFEELIAALLKDMGYSVELTSRSRDKGVDVYATQRSSIGDMLLIVQCKRYSALKRVGVGAVRDLYGTAEQLRATMAMLATTSFFTQPAHEFQAPVRHRLSLKDYDKLVTWLQRYGGYRQGLIIGDSPNPYEAPVRQGVDGP